jgi:hypothetical protein
VILDHLTAVTDRLEVLTTGATDMAVHVVSVDPAGTAPTGGTPVTPYVVLEPSLPTETDRLAGGATNLAGVLYVRCVGRTWHEAAFAQERTRALLSDWRPTVPGRGCAPLRLFDSQPARVDRDEPEQLIYAVDVYRIFSAPGPA